MGLGAPSGSLSPLSLRLSSATLSTQASPFMWPLAGWGLISPSLRDFKNEISLKTTIFTLGGLADLAGTDRQTDRPMKVTAVVCGLLDQTHSKA